MSDLQVFPISLPGGINQSAPEPSEEDLEELENFAIFRNRVGLRAPLNLIATIQDDQGTPADVDAILDIIDHEGSLWTASWSDSQEKVYLHSMQVDGTSLTLEAVVWTGVSSKPVVKMVSFEGGTAGSGTSRLYITDYNQNVVTRYWNGSSMSDLTVDFDADSSAEDVYFSLMVPYKFHLWGTGFYESAADRAEMARWSQPGLVPGTDSAGGSNPREWYSADHLSVGRRGDKIVAVGRAGDRLILFQKRATHVVYGSGTATWTRQELSNVVGCVGPHALAEVDGRVLYFWASDGPYRTNGSELEYIGQAIRQLVVESDASETDTRVGYSPDDGLVHFFVSNKGADSYSLVLAYDTRRDRWMRNSWVLEAEQTEDSYALDTGSPSAVGFGTYSVYGQTWTSSATPGPISKVKFGLRRATSTVSGNLYAKIYSLSGGAPSEVLSTSYAKDVLEVPLDPTFQFVTFDFDENWTPDVSTDYVVVIDGSEVASNDISMDFDTAGADDDSFYLNELDNWAPSGASQDYYFEVITRKADPTLFEFGAVAFLDSAAAPGPAGAPSSPTANGSSASTMTVTWLNGDTNVDTEIHIYRSTSTGFTPNDVTNRVGTVGSGAVDFLDTGLTDATTYYYKIRHYRNGQHSSESIEATGDTWLAAPTSVGLAGITDGLTISGTNNASDEDADIVIQRRNIGGAWSEVTTLTDPGSSFSHNDTGLTCGNTYEYRCKAEKSSYTDSAWSSIVSRSACLALTAPAAPSGFSAAADGETEIDLAWTDGSTNEDEFEIYRSTDGGSSYSFLASVAANSTSYSDTGLTSDTTYYYKVRATNTAGSSSFTSADSATTDPNLDAPTDLDATIDAINPQSELDLSWTDTAGDETAWQVEQSNTGSGSGYSLVATLGTGTTSHSITGLSAATQYWFRVRAITGSANGSYSNVVTATTLGTPPDAPTGLTATKNGGSPNDTMDIAWTDNASGEDGYEVQRSSTSSTGPWTVVSDAEAADSESYQDTGLTPGTEYWYRVRATDATNGDSDWSNVDSDTLDSTPTDPADPTDFTATPDDGDVDGTEVSAIDLSWTDNADNEDEYILERCSGVGCSSWEVIATLPADSESYRDTSVTDDFSDGTYYSYRLKASNAGGDSNYVTATDAIVEPQVTPVCGAAESSYCVEGIPIAQTTIFITNAGDVTGLESRKILVSVNGGSYQHVAEITTDPELTTEVTHGDLGDWPIPRVQFGSTYQYKIEDDYGISISGENTGTFTSNESTTILVEVQDCS